MICAEMSLAGCEGAARARRWGSQGGSVRMLLVLCLALLQRRGYGRGQADAGGGSLEVPLPAAFPCPTARARGPGDAWGALNLRGGGAEESDDVAGDEEGATGAPSDETLELLLKSEAELVGDAQSLINYADFLQESRKVQDMKLARTLYTRALQLEPACVDTHCSFGRLLQVAGQHDAAERHYKAALLLNPLHLDALSYSAVLAQERQDFIRASVCYEQVAQSSASGAACALPSCSGRGAAVTAGLMSCACR